MRSRLFGYHTTREVRVVPAPYEPFLTLMILSLLQERDEQLKKGVRILTEKEVDKEAQAGMGSMSLGELTQAVLVGLWLHASYNMLM